MYKFLKRYGFGKFAVLVIVAGLNDYQLKGKADKAYWLPLSNLLENKPVPEHPEELLRKKVEISRFLRRNLYKIIIKDPRRQTKEKE